MEKKSGWKKKRQLIRVLRILVQVCFWVCIAAGSLFIMGGIFSFVWPEAVTRVPGLFGLSGAVRLEINDAYLFSIGKVNPIFGAHVVSSIVFTNTWERLVFAYYAIPNFAMALFFHQFCRLMMAVEKGRSFAPENARRLTIMGLVPIGLFLLKTIIFTVYIALFSDVLFNLTYDFGGLFLGGILLILSRVFKHGKFLQDEYDATV